MLVYKQVNKPTLFYHNKHTLKHSIIVPEGYQVVSVNERLFLHNMPVKTSVKAMHTTRIVCDCPKTLSLSFESSVLFNHGLLEVATAVE